MQNKTYQENLLFSIFSQDQRHFELIQLSRDGTHHLGFCFLIQSLILVCRPHVRRSQENPTPKQSIVHRDSGELATDEAVSEQKLAELAVGGKHVRHKSSVIFPTKEVGKQVRREAGSSTKYSEEAVVEVSFENQVSLILCVRRHRLHGLPKLLQIRRPFLGVEKVSCRSTLGPSFGDLGNSFDFDSDRIWPCFAEAQALSDAAFLQRPPIHQNH